MYNYKVTILVHTFIKRLNKIYNSNHLTIIFSSTATYGIYSGFAFIRKRKTMINTIEPDETTH